MTRKIIDNIPILTTLVIIIGIVKLTLFYQNFSVPIKYFIGFSEVATTIADDLLFFLLIYAILRTIEIVLNDLKLSFTLFSSQDKLNIFYSVLFVLINIGLVIWGIVEKEYYRKIVNYAYSYFFLFLTLMQTKFAKDFFHKNKDFLFILYFFLLALLNIVNMTSREIKSVINGKYKGTKIVTNDTTYISSDTSYYIGQTEKYVFLYNTSKHYLVLPISSIKKLDIYINEMK